MNKFQDLDEVEEILAGLMEVENPMVIKLPRQSGQKESRYMHLFSGEPEINVQDRPVVDESATVQVRSENERIRKLEDEMALLSSEFNELKKAFTDLKSQFE